MGLLGGRAVRHPAGLLPLLRIAARRLLDENALWALATIVAYAASFLMLSRVLMRLPIGLTYGLWGGIGTVATAVIGMVLWGDPFNWLLGVGMALIIAGIAELARGFALADKQAAVEQISPQRD
ncbi:DMT family transporter [Adlercreutzia aquisgranensis]|uniref:DMT family transporter n=1 Tax=Adlercreutzia aquisgranensis TaxID=2941323 RepID=UPI00203A92DC|nr:SMR family transporter [Adlercreutzia aquisgranensis]